MGQRIRKVTSTKIPLLATPNISAIETLRSGETVKNKRNSAVPVQVGLKKSFLIRGMRVTNQNMSVLQTTMNMVTNHLKRSFNLLKNNQHLK
jgi:hypothetical protein